MPGRFTILVADRNPHVRGFLRRELSQEGYRVQLARDGRDVLMKFNSDKPPDLIILDPEIPHMEGVEILKEQQDPRVLPPVIVHSFLTEYANQLAAGDAVAFVEKRGNTEHLKATVREVLERCYPDRCGDER